MDKPWGLWDWAKTIVPIIFLVIVGGFASFYFEGHFFNFLGSTFPELNITYAVLQESYPNQNNLGVNVNVVDNGSGVPKRTVTISIINPTSTDTDYMMSMGRLVCNALEDSNLGSDTLTIQSVTEVNIVFFHYSSSPGGPSGDCDWWINASTSSVTTIGAATTTTAVTSSGPSQSFQGTTGTYAECKDGYQDFGTIASDTCIGHGGFLRWYW